MKRFLLLFLPLTVLGQTDPMPPIMLPTSGNWTDQVGVSGGIPTNQNQYITIPGNASIATIQNILNSIQSNTYARLPAGTYGTGSETLHIFANGVCLRGDVDANGNPASILNVAQVLFSGGGTWDMTVPSSYTSQPISSGATRGSSNITTSAFLNISPNTLMVIAAPSNSNMQVGYSGTLWSYYSTNLYCRMVRVLSTNGNTIAFWPPIAENYIQNAIAIRFLSGVTVHRSGIENCYISTTGGPVNWAYIRLDGTDECWVKNCHTYRAISATYMMEPWMSLRTEIRHNELDYSTFNGSSTYAIFPIDSSSLWIEDNYIHNMPQYIPMIGVFGSVISYNDATNSPYNDQTLGWLSQGFYYHGQWNSYNLFEGNFFPSDNSQGPDIFNGGNGGDNNNGSSYTTFFRNRIFGWDGADGGKTGNINALNMKSVNTWLAIFGNVLGISPAIQHYYWASGGGSCLVLATNAYYISNNWNNVDNGIHAGESLAGGQTMPASYIYASKPSWFGTLRWPPIDPTYPTNAASVIPAGYRAAFGHDPVTVIPSPTITITNPVATVLQDGVNPVTIQGTATSTNTLVAVTYKNQVNGNTVVYSGTASGTAQWGFSEPLQLGSNYVTVTVVDSANQTALTNITIIAESAPVASFSGTPLSGTAQLSVLFTNTSYANPYALAPTNSYWTFGQYLGTSSNVVLAVITNNASSLVFTFTNAGIYDVQLFVTNGYTAFSVSPLLLRKQYITVTNVNVPTPIADFLIYPTNGAILTIPPFPKFPVQVTALSTGSITNYIWNMGDGTIYNFPNLSSFAYNYTTTGTFSPSLTVIGPGGTNTITKTNYIVITNAPQTLAGFAISVAQPTSNPYTANTNWITFSGLITNQNPLVSVFVNCDRTINQSLGPVTNWSKSVPLMGGINNITVIATDNQTNVASTNVTVNYVPPWIIYVKH